MSEIYRTHLKDYTAAIAFLMTITLKVKTPPATHHRKMISPRH